MKNWTQVTLGEVADTLVGYAFKSAKFTSELAGQRLLRGVNVHQGFTDWRQEARWPTGEPYAERYQLEQGDVVLAMDRPWIEAGLKRSRLKEADLPALLVQRVARLRGTEKATTSFIHHTLASEVFSRYLQVQVTGATVPHISQKQIEGFQFFLPPLEVQHSVCNVLDSIDDLIENNRRRVELLEQMARAIYREWFVHFRYPGHEDVPLVDSALGPIPQGWEVMPVSKAILINPRIKLDKTIDHPFISMGDLDERGMSCRPSEARRGGSGSKFERGDTLFARITPCLQNGKTGFVQSLANGEVGMGSTEFIVFRGTEVGEAYTYCLARESDFRQHAIASMSGASGRQRVRNECFDSYEIAAPPQIETDLFESTSAPLFAQVRTLQDENEQLSSLRDKLLPKLVTGQIDVSSLDIDALVDKAVTV